MLCFKVHNQFTHISHLASKNFLATPKMDKPSHVILLKNGTIVANCGSEFHCPEGRWKCEGVENTIRCIHWSQVCDGTRNCPFDGSDELNCPSCPAGHIRCADSTCVKVSTATICVSLTTGPMWKFQFHCELDPQLLNVI